jgi:hypothetical protein
MHTGYETLAGKRHEMRASGDKFLCIKLIFKVNIEQKNKPQD